jgi:hypothetical protein
VSAQSVSADIERVDVNPEVRRRLEVNDSRRPSTYDRTIEVAEYHAAIADGILGNVELIAGKQAMKGAFWELALPPASCARRVPPGSLRPLSMPAPCSRTNRRSQSFSLGSGSPNESRGSGALRGSGRVAGSGAHACQVRYPVSVSFAGEKWP